MKSRNDLTANSYEEICRIVEGLVCAEDLDSRDLHWLTAKEVLGVSRNRDGHLEIFIASDRLDASLRIVRDNLDFDNWRRNSDIEFSANRMLFPPLEHFDSVVAFLCVELIKQGIDSDPHSAFKHQEPVIALALERHAMADTSVIGLLGELFVLYWMLQHVPRDQRLSVINSWTGFERSSRDFRFHTVGIEVKTTRGLRSKHHMAGVHQVEVEPMVGDYVEEKLFLVSIGCTISTDESEPSLNIPVLVDAILELVKDIELKDADETKRMFIERVARYGIGEEVGYDHLSMSGRERFRRKWSISFVRGYDMTDSSIRVLTRNTLQPLSNVVEDSVEFWIDLPDVVRGDLNPTVGMRLTIDRIFESARVF